MVGEQRGGKPHLRVVFEDSHAALRRRCGRVPCARVVLLAALLCLQVAVAASVPSGERGGASDTGRSSGRDAPGGTGGQTSETGLPRRRGIRRYLEERGVGVQDIPKALLVYESISIGLL